MDGDGGHTRLLDPLDQADGVVQLKTGNNDEVRSVTSSGKSRFFLYLSKKCFSTCLKKTSKNKYALVMKCNLA